MEMIKELEAYKIILNDYNKELESGTSNDEYIEEKIMQCEYEIKLLVEKIENARKSLPERKPIQKDQYYRHFKGMWYKVLHIAIDSEDHDKKIVVYKALYGNHEIYVREYEMFKSFVEIPKYTQYPFDTYRFTSYDELVDKLGEDKVKEMMENEIQ